MSPRERAAAQEEEKEEEEGGEGGGKAAAADIPADICEEILYRLSCTQLSELRFVCKDWLRLISSPKFIEKHLERSNGTRIVTLSYFGKIQEYRYAGGQHIDDVSSKAKLGDNNTDLRILGSCDGLVLFKVDYYKIALMNPCTGMTDIRDDIDLLVPSKIMWSWFGRHPSTREYVLVLVKSEDHVKQRLVFQVYSLSGNRTINTVSIENLNVWNMHQSMTSFQCIGTFLHGRVHFPVFYYSDDEDERYTILGFDFESNEIFKMSAPTQSYFKLGVVEGCLSATVAYGPLSSIIEMWIMKEQRWSKYAKINVGYRVFLNNPIACFPNGDVIFEGDDEGAGQLRILLLYSLKDMKTIEAHYTVDKYEAIACVESLVTPAMVWRGKINQDYIHNFTR